MKKTVVVLMILLCLTAISACSQTGQTVLPDTASGTYESEPYSSSESKTAEPSEPLSVPPEEQSEDSSSNLTAAILKSPSVAETPGNMNPVESTAPVSETEKPPIQDNVPAAEPPKPETPPSESPVQEAEPQPEPSYTEEPAAPPVEEPAFDISYWVQYAQSYAASVGLQLHKEAVYCWDTPISANAKCLYLERDIQSRLNRYAGDEEITLVWIWTVQLSEGNYEIYIGYA